MIFPEKRTKGQLKFQVSFLERKKKGALPYKLAG
jgi:hypothetical protein